MTKLKFCEFCKKNITCQNFTTHKNTEKHKLNKENYKHINLLDDIKEDEKDIKYFKIQLEEIKNNIEQILQNLK